jgi:hypothetical protein
MYEVRSAAYNLPWGAIMKASNRFGAAVLTAAFLLVGPACHASQIIQNGTFVDGSLADWSSTFASGWTSASATADGTGSVDTGAVYLPAAGASPIPPITCCAQLTQTVTDQVGTSYSLSLDTMETSGPTSGIAVYWNGVLEDSWINAANNTYPNWVQLIGSGSYIGTGSDIITIVAYQNPGALYRQSFVRNMNNHAPFVAHYAYSDRVANALCSMNSFWTNIVGHWM